MRVLNNEELAILLYESESAVIAADDRQTLGLGPPQAWHEIAEWLRDDYRSQARNILQHHRVGRVGE